MAEPADILAPKMLVELQQGEGMRLGVLKVGLFSEERDEKKKGF